MGVSEGNRQLSEQISIFKDQAASDANTTEEQRAEILNQLSSQIEVNNNLLGNLKQIGKTIESISEVIKGGDKLSSQGYLMNSQRGN